MLKTLLSVMVTGCLALTPALAAEPADDKTKSEIQEMLKQHDEAVNQHDLEGVLATYAKSENIVLMGTGPGEVWVGKEAIADAYKHVFENFDKGKFKHECPWKTGAAQGDTAWLMASCQMKETQKDQTREYVLNVSAVLKKNDGAWRFQNMHFSNLTGGGPQ
jgi:uncharacterized protein (TIGR02246 family)